jgi:hypothetical protein
MAGIQPGDCRGKGLSPAGAPDPYIVLRANPVVTQVRDSLGAAAPFLSGWARSRSNAPIRSRSRAIRTIATPYGDGQAGRFGCALKRAIGAAMQE